mmetsp:Transcript_18658/g.25714  ORF Transcript_18658/g.25714 Transcript_18658/m.25714 type:complete len:134 (-) Transcript_18658:135-536(-)|eukprot:CAMPEP_0185723974 /NCGR_PEP_ID=MMETSP1171-20130828/618_1 /TAXON_ID=374046 /ORGANISM="Helicotheca tamensis, Strain CCMP826" /LENGTH=133 /DNA_ID=CAMNT_0028391745 /DNA_START=29 /DNA_END=430 /DNA_ORIENTATION=+
MTKTKIFSIAVLLSSNASSMAFTQPRFGANRAETSIFMSSSGPEIEVISQADEEFLKKKGVFSWGTWGCGVSKFPWTYGENESCYLLEGKVTVTPDDGRAAATFGKGDFVTFPAGMSCTWDVSEAVQKHFLFF